MPSPADAAGRPAAAPRILAAARDLVARGGAAAISMGDVAAAAGVSKALVHYHFRDKDSLLVALAERAGDAVLGRAGAALAPATDEHVLDAWWAALEQELTLGDLRILLVLGECDSERVRAACRGFAARRREQAAAQVASVFERLGLGLRVPAGLVADTVVAFTDGLAIGQALEPGRSARPAFDVLWLSLLTLAE